MKKITLLILGLFTWMISFSQVDINQLFEKHPEVVIKFQIQDRSQLEMLARIISIDNIQGNEVTAYTNPEEFMQFLTLNIPYEIVERLVLTIEELNMMEDTEKNRNDWNYYPTYNQYLSEMEEFASKNPDLCRVVEFGTSVQNRKLLACVISSNVHVREAEPQIFWSSSMHGDELTGYVLMLRFIDYLLSNYGTNERITHLLDNSEIWINPLANPDGTFWPSGARRNNANNFDLNRNYKDWVAGNNPGGAWQKETIAFMNLQETEAFVLGANIHGGIETCNYPWDNTYTRHADDNWWQLVCREYADTVHAHAPSTYMRAFNNGITNGADWTVIYGSRQDYTTYYDHNREFTLEISNTKTPSPSQLPNFWNYNYRSFLNYTQQALYGIHGTVTDANNGLPLHAKVFINSHDKDNSFVMTDPRVGYYARPIKGGTYSVTYSAEGYISQTVQITVSDRQTIIQNIELVASTPPQPKFVADSTTIPVYTEITFTDQSSYAPTSWKWHFEGGTPGTSIEQNPTILYETTGTFDVKLVVENSFGKDSIIKENYITVIILPEFPVANFEADATEIEEGNMAHFIDLSENATTWEWYFEGGTPETSIEQNPIILYENAGIFDVKLTVTNEDGSDEMLKEGYIVVVIFDTVATLELERFKVKIFPNPVLQESALTIEADSFLHKIELINLLGAIVKTAHPNAASYVFPVSGIETGIYLMKIETAKGAFVTKIQIL
ncbi:MAG: PKD domain-containing protein [Bacteroidetes bacterium]|nr:PKD domain-containing protein [Bacteroidota bacterium]MCL2301925.1 PKD domain-containing protein [Lentimicrobiaceae bacterium]